MDLDYYHRNTSYMLRHDVVGIGGWFLESLRAVCPMSTLFAGPSLPMHNRPQFGWMPLSGLQGYALHSAAVRGTLASQAPLPTLFSVDEFKLGKWPVSRLRRMGTWDFFYSLSREVRPLQTRVVARRGACFQSFFLLPTILPIVSIW